MHSGCMPTSIRFALLADPIEAGPAFEEMASAVSERAPLTLEPMFVSSYAGLSQAVENGTCDAAWSPPLVAQGLLASGMGRPLVAVGRGGRTSYYSVLLARGEGSIGLTALARARIGWVSKLSAAGYVVPSLYLRSLGLEPDELFAAQSFLGSHRAVLRALADGEVDLAATYATLARGGRTLLLPDDAPAGTRVVTAAGPIPGDVVFAGATLRTSLREMLRGALLAYRVACDGPLGRLMNVDRFEVPALDHFETLRRWRDRAVESERPATLAARQPPRTDERPNLLRG
jgi:phosphonate transport system substrate-binding protein